MNLDSTAADTIEIHVWSDTDATGIVLATTETGNATGIFKGVIQFSTTNDLSDGTLSASKTDMVTARYKDRTLPYQYTTTDELDIVATWKIPPSDNTSNSADSITGAHCGSYPIACRIARGRGNRHHQGDRS